MGERALGSCCGGGNSIPEAVHLHLLASDSRWLCIIVQPRFCNGLSVPKAAEMALQQYLQQAASEPCSSTNILVLQRMQYDGVLSPDALGMQLLAGRDSTPAVGAEAARHATPVRAPRGKPSSAADGSPNKRQKRVVQVAAAVSAPAPV